MDIGLITAGITAATSAIGLFDLIADQVERFITKQPEPAIPTEHRLNIKKENGAIVVRDHGQEFQRITGADLANLPESQLQHIKVLEQSMQNHYAIWAAVYPQLALQVDPITKARIEQQLKGIIVGMKGDLNGILGFLQSSGVQLDDHYLHIRDVVNQVQ